MAEPVNIYSVEVASNDVVFHYMSNVILTD